MKSLSGKKPDLQNRLTEAEKVIYNSAVERSGIFAHTCRVEWEEESGVILSDGSSLYPLGDIGNNTVPVANHSCVLGGKENVLKVLGWDKGEKWKLMDKVFAKYVVPDHPLMVDLPDGMVIETVESRESIEEFCRMKARFIEEESGDIVSLEKLREEFAESGGDIFPVIMRLNGDAAGMVSSGFHTMNGAMINMLFVKKEYRTKGYGMRLLDWYIRFLNRFTGKIYLFYSPENEPARKLYEKRGFVEIDRWLMAVR